MKKRGYEFVSKEDMAVKKTLSEAIITLADNMVNRTFTEGEQVIVQAAMRESIIPRNWRFVMDEDGYRCNCVRVG